jgi:putative DNA primase/helicase
MRAEEIAERIGSGWPNVLAQLGVPEAALRNKHGPCPACGGKDRFRFDNRRHRGDFFCNHCGAGSGFDLLMRMYGWDFSTARDQVVRAAGLSDSGPVKPEAAAPIQAAQELAYPTGRVLRLLVESCAVADCPDAVEYLAHRHLWPLPPNCTLRAHPCVEYFEEGRRMGRYSALIAKLTDIEGETASIHVTFLENSRKLLNHEPRKILSPLTGRIGCAVRLQQPQGEALGVAEGLETALAAARLHNVPTWAALNTSLLAKFDPPAQVKRLIVFADRDVPGLEAAARLMEKLQGKVALEIKTPPPPVKDWADVLATRSMVQT